ncbi:hypothetical protein [Intrasporangium sp.]|jgi:hypothetical protein|uniref:hypothetical protein n=1 Tax=Intrasporangium sp. TaxID=1925024 RepID=UPI003365A96D
MPTPRSIWSTAWKTADTAPTELPPQAIIAVFDVPDRPGESVVPALVVDRVAWTAPG